MRSRSTIMLTAINGARIPFPRRKLWDVKPAETGSIIIDDNGIQTPVRESAQYIHDLLAFGEEVALDHQCTSGAERQERSQ